MPVVLVVWRRDPTRLAEQEPGNDTGSDQSPRLLVGDDNGIAFSRRQGSPDHRPGVERSGKRVWSPQRRDIPERSEALSVPQECRGRRFRSDAPGAASRALRSRIGSGTSAMNAIPFGRAASQPLGMISNGPKSDPSSDVAWMVLEDANDFVEDTTIDSCRRVIAASLAG